MTSRSPGEVGKRLFSQHNMGHDAEKTTGRVKSRPLACFALAVGRRRAPVHTAGPFGHSCALFSFLIKFCFYFPLNAH